MKAFFDDWDSFFNAVNVFASCAMAICVALLAREQNRLVKAQARIDAQERRLRVFDAIMRFLANINVHGTTDGEALQAMVRETRHAQFVFPRTAKIQELVTELYEKGLDLEYCEKDLENLLRSESLEETRRALVQESRKLKDWFRAKRPAIEELFRPFLEIAE